MARIRNIKPEFFLNETIAALPFQTQLCYIGLWTQADREGRLEDRPARLKASIFPYHAETDMDDLLDQLVKSGFIIRYVAEGEHFIYIPKFRNHQCFSTLEKKQPIKTLPYTDSSQTIDRLKTVSRQADIGHRTYDEGRMTKDVGSYCPESAEQTSGRDESDPPVLEFPTNGNVKSWSLRTSKLHEWESTYPGVDVLAECRKARQWVIDNRRKTATGMPKFLNGWLSRANDRGRPPNYQGNNPPATQLDPDKAAALDRLHAMHQGTAA